LSAKIFNEIIKKNNTLVAGMIDAFKAVNVTEFVKVPPL
jgi:hypothetical protein